MQRPWHVRAVARSPLGPVATGACVTVVLLASNLVAYAGERLDLLIYMPLGIGYVLAVSAIGARALARDVHDLLPHLACSEQDATLLESSCGRYPARLLWGAGAGGVVLTLALGLLARPVVGVPGPWLFLLVAESLLFWVMAVPMIVLVVEDARRLGRIGRAWLVPPLFEPEVLAPFGRAGLRGALVILVIFGVRILFYAIEAPRPLVLANLGPMIACTGLAIAALGIPSLGARHAVRRAKHAELARVREALRAHPFAPGDSLAEGVPRSWLDLLAYRDRLQAVREWPLDAPALLRFGFYLLIPVFGWVGGALVERLLSLFLD